MKTLYKTTAILAGVLISGTASAGWFDDVIDWVDDNIVDPIEDAVETVVTFTGEAIDWVEGAVYTVGDFVIDSAEDLAGYYEIVEDATSDTGYSSSGGLDFSAPTSPAADSGTLVVATYNVHGFPEALNGISDSEARQISTMMENWAWDIGALQEDWVVNDALMQNLTTLTYPSRSRHYAGDATTFGDGLLTIAGHDSFGQKIHREEFNDCYGTLWEYIQGKVNSPDCQADKGFTMAAVQLASDMTVHVYNTHLNTAGIESINKSQLNQIENYMLANSAGYPVILMGDFNMRYSNSMQAGLLDNFLANTGLTMTCDKNCSTSRIDHIMYRGNSQSRIELSSETTLDDNGLSDHKPRQATLAWARKNVNSYSLGGVDENADTTGEDELCGGNTLGNIVLADVTSYNGSDPSVLRMYSSSGTCYVKIQEDESNDSETGHANETVDVIALTDNFPYGETGVISTDENWKTVNLNNNYANPVVIAFSPTMNGGDPATVMLRNISGNSFETSVQEFEWDDRNHINEDIHYLVIEAGIYNIDGRTLIAGVESVTTTLNGNAVQHTVNTGLANYKVVTTVQNSDSSYILDTEVKRSSNSFTMGFMPEEAKDHSGATISGQIGYIALED